MNKFKTFTLFRKFWLTFYIVDNNKTVGFCLEDIYKKSRFLPMVEITRYFQFYYKSIGDFKYLHIGNFRFSITI